MPDDPKEVGEPDRKRISQQPHEIEYEAHKEHVSPELVREVVRREGPMRENVEREIQRIKTNG